MKFMTSYEHSIYVHLVYVSIVFFSLILILLSSASIQRKNVRLATDIFRANAIS